MIVDNGSPNTSLKDVVLFPFDDHSIPFQHGLKLHLVGYRTSVGETRIVVPPGPQGAPDCEHVVYYGTVRRVGDELWMWYLGQGTEDRWHQRVCLARSADGRRWEKPKLGLVEYNGSAANNLIELLPYNGPSAIDDRYNPGRAVNNVTACVVFYEPDDPDPSRRFKMMFETPSSDRHNRIAFSADGLHWKESEKPSGALCEMSGVTKWGGCYYITAQGGRHFGVQRELVTFASYNFETWTQASCVGLRRGNIPPRPMNYDRHAGEQVHLGAGLWDRGNVIIGIYGQWHGHRSNDRRLTTMDLGLVVSVDALHYKEPIPDFRMVGAAEDNWEMIPAGIESRFAALMQGQGFENVGNETLFWYGPWPEHRANGVRLATWKRDRLGYFEMLGTQKDAHFISAPIDMEGRPAKLYLNVAGISEHARAEIEILDERFRPIAGYSREACIGPVASGLRQRVTWEGHETIEAEGRIRVRAGFGGLRPEDVKLYAVYVEQA